MMITHHFITLWTQIIVIIFQCDERNKIMNFLVKIIQSHQESLMKGFIFVEILSFVINREIANHVMSNYRFDLDEKKQLLCPTTVWIVLVQNLFSILLIKKIFVENFALHQVLFSYISQQKKKLLHKNLKLIPTSWSIDID